MSKNILLDSAKNVGNWGYLNNINNYKVSRKKFVEKIKPTKEFMERIEKCIKDFDKQQLGIISIKKEP